ncbi:MAG: two-component system sensor histidine kinase NtrB, partial [Gemmatimonadota bacterium]
MMEPSRDGLTNARRVLYWIYVGRLIVTLSVYGGAFVIGEGWVYEVAGLGDLRVRTLAVVILAGVGLATLVSYGVSHIRRVEPLSPHFVYAQAALDVLLITGTVHLTGGSGSVFPPLLYIALVSGYALITPLTGGAVIALSSGLAYMADIGFAYAEQMGPAVLGQIMVFTVVALVSGAIGGKLREVGDELTSVESELRRLRFGTSDILRTIDTAVLTLDAEGRAVYLNPAAAELLDLDPERWIGEPVLERIAARAPRVASAAEEAIESRRPIPHRDAEVRDRADREIPYAVSTTVLERAGSPPIVTLVLQDQTLARQLEELHLRAGRLAVVQELSSSLAHEIRNPLASIRSAVEQVVDAGAGGEDYETLGRLIVRETDRLSRLLGEFNDFARVGVAERRPIDLGRVIREAVEVVSQRPESRDRAAFEVEIASGLDDLWGDPDLVHRTLTNLMLNAVQVGAPAPVAVRVVADALGTDLVPADPGCGLPVRIRVIDDGPGIAPEDIRRIFDPFYT